MKLWSLVLGCLLAISAATNVYFYLNLRSENDSSVSVGGDYRPNGDRAVISAKPQPQLQQNITHDLQQHIERQAPQRPSSDQKQQWLEQNRNWIAIGEYVNARHFIQLYLRKHPNDIDFLLLESDLIAGTENINAALAHYYSILDLALSPRQRLEVKAKIDNLAVSNIDKLKQVKSWDILASFTEPLWQFSPNERNYTLALAEAYAQQKQRSLMENVLASLDNDDPDVLRIRQLLNSADVSTVQQQDSQSISPSDDATAVPLQRNAGHYTVAANFGTDRLELIIDTGASTTALSQYAFDHMYKRHPPRFIGKYMVNTAGGQVEASIYQFVRLSIADFVVKDTAVMVLPTLNFDQTDGLLGMNFLGEFEFKIDQQQGILYLK